MTARPRRPALVLVGLGVVTAAIAITDPVRGPIQNIIDFALAPDGRSLAFTAVDADGHRRLWVRSYPGGAERVIEGSDGAASPFWSHDSGAIAYVSDGMLRRVALSGGTPALITEAAPMEGAWYDQMILFMPGHARAPLHRIPLEGGPATPATDLRPGETRHAWPAFLPDGRRFLYTVMFEAGGAPAIHLGSLDGMDGREVLSNASRAAVADGYLVYLRDGGLMVQLFDTDMLIPRSDPIPVDELGVTSFSVSRDGLLAYQQGSPALTLVDWRAAGGR
jgi:eukaryotic-like serine/threonine-protein kinase